MFASSSTTSRRATPHPPPRAREATRSVNRTRPVVVVGQLDVAAVRLGDRARDGEPEAGAPRPGGEERLEQARHDFRRASPDRRSRPTASPPPPGAGDGADGDHPAGGGGVEGVDHQVEERLVDLERVDEHVGVVRAVVHQPDPGLGLAGPRQTGNVPDGGRERGRSAVRLLLPGVAQEVLGQALQPAGLVAGDGAPLAQLGAWAPPRRWPGRER